jgi:acyl-CoA carboxylase epsilon subunit
LIVDHPDESKVVLRVVRGAPTDDELAALIAVVAARRAAADVSASRSVRRSGWTDRSRALRGIHHHGPNGWRSAALPR